MANLIYLYVEFNVIDDEYTLLPVNYRSVFI